MVKLLKKYLLRKARKNLEALVMHEARLRADSAYIINVLVPQYENTIRSLETDLMLIDHLASEEAQK